MENLKSALNNRHSLTEKIRQKVATGKKQEQLIHKDENVYSVFKEQNYF